METRDEVSEILQARCGKLTVATLDGKRRLEIHNVAWGRDMGATCDHITTNISPAPQGLHTVDFFHSSEVVSLEASESGAMLYAGPVSKA